MVLARTPSPDDLTESAFIIGTTVPARNGTADVDPNPASKITGGAIHPEAGSGTLTIKDDQVEAGDDVSKITLIYEAATALEDVTLEIDVKGIQVADDDADEDPVITSLQDTTDDAYGFVSGSVLDSAPDLAIADATAIDIATATGPVDGVNTTSTTITWSGLTFTKAGEKFTITIEDVRIQEAGGNVVFTTRMIGGTDIGK